MIPRWLLFIGLVLGIWYVWSRRQIQQAQLSNPNPNWNKGVPDTGSSLLDLFPISSLWQNQGTSSAGRAQESYIPQLAASWLDGMSSAIGKSLRKDAPAAGNNDDWDATWDQYNSEVAQDELDYYPL